jgi:ATP-dependent exoDNAse (exonuclease V) beta subunit
MEAPYVLSYNIRAYNDDEARLCYVAATRARDFLIWAKTPPKKRKRNTGVVNWE